MRNNLKIPPPPLSMRSMMTDRDVDFCDLYITSHKLPEEIFQMTHGGAFTATDRRRKAGTMLSDSRIKAFIQNRTIQLNEWFFGDGTGETRSVSEEPRSIEDVMVKNQARVIEAIDEILQNRSDPNYADVVKLHLQKLLKDVEMDRVAEPPRRYLPESCDLCRYKLFVEESCIDECKRCKYRKFGEENGLTYDHKNQLEDV